MKFTARQWTIYFACWTPYIFGYVAVFAAQNPRSDLFWNVRTAFLNVVPAALCGVLAVRFCRRLRWRAERIIAFLALQTIAALAYSVLWYALVITIMTVDLSIRRAVFSPVTFGGYALPWQFFSGLMIYATVASVVYALQISGDLRAEEQRRRAAEIRVAETQAAFANAQLAALRAQLNPHFLFNTLHSLMALVRYEPRAAEDALEKLAEMLRYVLNDKRAATGEKANLVRLGDELKFVENYLTLEKMRLGERLTIENSIDARALDCPIPAFTVQPIIENAVKHGIAPRARRGTIRIKAEIENEKLLIEIRDDGAGARFEQTINASGLGLRLVREQLALHYGERADFKIETAANAGFAALVSLPIENLKLTTLKTNSESSRVFS